jgi:AcrR family transcriptional regulator
MSILSSGNDEGGPKLKPTWGGDSPQAEAARARLLEATCRCIEREGFGGASMAAIAAEAGVSRQTVYRYFSGPGELAKRAIFATAEALQEKIANQVALLADPADVIVEALVLGLREIRSHGVLRAIWDRDSPDGTVAEIFTHPSGIAWVRHANSRAIELAGWDEDFANTAMEFVLRVGLSLLISAPPERSDEELRAFLYRHLVPGLGLRVLEEIPSRGATA